MSTDKILSKRCFGAASAKDRLDVVIRDAINAGDIPGPRYLANGKEMARRDGELVAGITAFADGPDEMREVIRHHVNIGVDNIKLSMSGEEVSRKSSPKNRDTEPDTDRSLRFDQHKIATSPTKKRQLVWKRHTNTVNDFVPTLELETRSRCVSSPSHHIKSSTANNRDQGIRHGVEAIYHASYIDDEGMSMLEAAKTKHIVAPAINWLIATLNEAEAFGYSHAQAEKVGYKRELDAAIKGLREMHQRGIVVLPGGDYGFAWTPHGTYARDLEHFVKLLGFTPHEALIAATAGVAKLMMRSDNLGKIQPGYFADCILVDGNPLDDITILQDHSKLNIICINGRVHKAGRKEYIPPPVAGQDNNSHVIVPDMEYPDVERAMQKQY